jgi:hypothetical protein
VAIASTFTLTQLQFNESHESDWCTRSLLSESKEPSSKVENNSPKWKDPLFLSQLGASIHLPPTGMTSLFKFRLNLHFLCNWWESHYPKCTSIMPPNLHLCFSELLSCIWVLRTLFRALKLPITWVPLSFWLSYWSNGSETEAQLNYFSCDIVYVQLG